MPNPRKSLDEIKLTGDHVARALKRPPAKTAAKKKELLALFNDLESRRDAALEDVRERGAVIIIEKWSAGKNIKVEVLNPYLAIAERCEKSMIAIAKALNAFGETPGASPARTALNRELDTIFEEFEERKN
jgi:hypothetical protein